MTPSLRVRALQEMYRYATTHGGRMPSAAFCGPMTYRDLVRDMQALLRLVVREGEPRWITIGGVNHYPGPGRVGYRFYYGGPEPRPGESGLEFAQPADPLTRPADIS
jgi:hypothetical protein